ncbi:MAG: sensor histidine kinase [Rhodopseudomonas palustris]|nr:sensor histidine kinase [Rhodopseudomonas palustris]
MVVDGDDEVTSISITDQGAGLSPEDIGRLFGRFQRLSAKPTAGESSTGLGLSIVKKIIDMHGGEVQAAGVRAGRRSDLHHHAAKPARSRMSQNPAHHRCR